MEKKVFCYKTKKVRGTCEIFKFCWLLLTNQFFIRKPTQAIYEEGGINILHENQLAAERIGKKLDRDVGYYFCKFHFKDNVHSQIAQLLKGELTILSKDEITQIVEEMREIGAEEEAEYYQGYLQHENISMLIFPGKHLKVVEELLKADGKKELNVSAIKAAKINHSILSEQNSFASWEIEADQLDYDSLLRWGNPYMSKQDLRITTNGSKKRISLISNQDTEQKKRRLSFYFGFQKVIPIDSKADAQNFMIQRYKRRPKEKFEIVEGYFAHKKDDLEIKKYKRDLGAAIHLGRISQSAINTHPFICIVFIGPKNVGDAIESEYQVFKKDRIPTKMNSSAWSVDKDFPELTKSTPDIKNQEEVQKPHQRSDQNWRVKQEAKTPEQLEKQKTIPIQFPQTKPQFVGVARLMQQVNKNINSLTELITLTLPHIVQHSLNQPNVLKTLQNQLATIVKQMRQSFPTFEAELSISEDSLVLEATIKRQIGYILPGCAQHIEDQLTNKLTVEKVIEIGNTEGALTKDMFAGREFIVTSEGDSLWVFGYGIKEKLKEIKKEIMSNLFAPTFTELEKDSAEFKKIKKLSTTKQLKISKVQNAFLQQRWNQEKENMQQEKKLVSEQLLFYGTRNVDPTSICRSGFAAAAELQPYEDFFSSSDVNQHRQAFIDPAEPKSMKLLLCKVLLGNEFQVEDYDQLSEEPEKLNEKIIQTLQNYDSVMFELANNKNFVIKNKWRVYPEYIVTID